MSLNPQRLFSDDRLCQRVQWKLIYETLYEGFQLCPESTGVSYGKIKLVMKLHDADWSVTCAYQLCTSQLSVV